VYFSRRQQRGEAEITGEKGSARLPRLHRAMKLWIFLNDPDLEMNSAMRNLDSSRWEF
jgi:hypothetical protein